MRIIKKYSNRRLYDTSSSTYVNLGELADLIRGGERVQILDARTGEDLTRAVLVQVLLEAQGGLEVLPLGFLHRMIRMGGDNNPMQAMFRRQIAAGLDLLDAQVSRMEEQLNLLRPDRPPAAAPPPSGTSAPPPDDEDEDDAPRGGTSGSADGEMDALRARLAALEARLSGSKGR